MAHPEENPPSKEALFADLLKRCGDAAYNFAFRLCGNAQDADDLVQGAFMKALENIDRYDPGQPFTPWLNTILHNLYLDGLKRYERRHTVSLDAPSPAEERSWSEVLPGKEPEPLADLGRTELEETVQKALGQLDVPWRAAVVLSDIEQLSYEEIARVLGCPVGTVRSRIHRGRTMLKEILQPYLAASEVKNHD